MQKTFAILFLIGVKCVAYYFAIVYGLGIQPRSLAVLGGFIVTTAVIAALLNQIKAEEKAK